MSERSYTQEEVARLIRRAVELEAQRTQQKHGSGLHLEDLKHIAGEAGIDPEMMLLAAREMENEAKNGFANNKRTMKVHAQEIVCEHWLNGEANKEQFGVLVSELNLRFGTSEDDINWWHNLWKDYSGKARIRRTENSVDWTYTDELEFYQTRVLLQNRNGRLRIRVSKKQGYGMEWNTENRLSWYIIPMLAGGLITGIMAGKFIFNMAVTGGLLGLALGGAMYLFYKAYSRVAVEKHQREVEEIAEMLAEQAHDVLQTPASSAHSSRKTNSGNFDSVIREDSSSSDDTSSSSASGRIRNALR